MALSPISLSTLASGSGGFVINGACATDNAGGHVAWAGDINGDGFADLLIGASQADPASLSNAGRTYVLFGSSGGFSGTIDATALEAGTGGFVINGATAGDMSGSAVAGAGDINGDGYADLVVGAPVADPGGLTNAGAAYVIFGHSGAFGPAVNLSDIAAGTGGFVLTGQTTNDQLGWAVSTAGDINGDGLDDLVVGAPFASPSANSSAGKSYIVFGRRAPFTDITLSDIAAGSGGFVIDGTLAGDRAGYAVSSAGDLNNDGYDDLLIDAMGADPGGNTFAGQAYVMFGKAGGFGAGINLSALSAGIGGFRIDGLTPFATLGASLSSAGDVNGDGFADILLGSNAAVPGGTEPGKAYVIFGKASGFGASVSLTAIAAGSGGFTITGQTAGDAASVSVSAAGDINADGIDDILVGAPLASPSGGTNAGKAYVVFGTTGGFGTGVALSNVEAGIGGFVLNGAAPFDRAGNAVSTAGDMDGDGFGDIVIGAYRSDPGGRTDAGRAYVVLGRDFTGAVTKPGTDGNNDLTGTAGADVMVGGRGNDSINGGSGGADVLIGGAGDDTLIVGDLGFRRVDGGAGIDTLRFAGAWDSVDLGAIADMRIQNIEVIDLTAGGNNTLSLTRREVLAISSTSNTLTVEGDLGDVVMLPLEGWTMAGIAAGYRTLVNGQATLKVDTDITLRTWGTTVADATDGRLGFTIYGTAKSDSVGLDVGLGDINGDGFSDVLLGRSEAGAVAFGGAGPFGPTIMRSDLDAGVGGFVLNRINSGDSTGQSIASAGDVNGDGIADLVIGAYGGDGPGNTRGNSGEAYVVFGRTGGFGAAVDLSAIAAGTGGFVVYGASAGDFAGRSVSGAGDVNGDGLDDVVIGAPETNVLRAGKAYVVYGATGGFPAAIDGSSLAAGTGGFVIVGEANEDQAGFSVSSAGDINGDGLDDLLIAAPWSVGADANSRDMYVVFGRSGGLGPSVALSDIAAGRGGFVVHGTGLSNLGNCGSGVSTAGDFNGDGIADLMVGVIGSSTNAAWVVFGRTQGFGASVNLSDVAAGTGGFLIAGTGNPTVKAVSAAGDVNGDGYDDLVIGVISDRGAANASFTGSTYVVFGRETAAGGTISISDLARGIGGFVVRGRDGNDQAGYSVSGAADINGDGFDDLVIGAPGGDGVGNTTSDAGEIYVIYGGDFNFTGTVTGTAGNDGLTGTPGADQMVGGRGNDIIDGKGGTDVLIGGAGDDVLKVADTTFRRVDGGAGFDTMALTGAGQTLDLRAVADLRIQDIEAIDLTGSGNNTLVLTRLEVVNLSPLTNMVTIGGNSGDRVLLAELGWSKGATAGGYTDYTAGLAVIRVATGISVASSPASAPDLASASDTGASSTDNVTSDPTPVLTGRTTPFSAVKLFAGDTEIGNTVASATGEWSITTSSLADGPHLIRAQATDGSGHVSLMSATLTVTVDTSVATPAMPDMTAATDTGSSNSDNLTRNAQPTFTGIAEAGATVELLDGATVIGSSKAGSTGAWTIRSTVLSDGAHAVSVRAFDAAGNISAASPALPVTIDTKRPATPSVPDMTATSDTGLSSTDNITETVTPTFTGTAEAGAIVTVYDGATTVGTGTADAGGVWSIKTSVLTAGSHTIKAKATDAAGNVSVISAGLVITVDTAAPAAPASLDLAAASDTGKSSTDNITNAAALMFTAKTEAGASVALFDGATLLGTAVAGATGAWALTVGPLAEGPHAITARATDVAGKVGATTAVLTVTVDTSWTSPTVPDMFASSDTGISGSDNITRLTTPSFTGKGEVGATVQLFDGATSIGSGTVNAGGTWSIKSKALEQGAHAISARSTDVAGNVSATTAGLAITIDTTPPDAPMIAKVSTTALSGLAEAKSVVRVSDGATVLGTATTDAGGTWTLAVALSPGMHVLAGTATDIAGNVSAASPPRPAVVGTAGNDTLAATGANFAAGGAGNDVYEVDDPGDVTTEAVGQGTDTVLASIGYTLPAASEIEFLTSAAAGGITLGGNGFANTITGGAGGDTLVGAGGVDTFRYLALTDSQNTAGQLDTIFDFDDAAGEKLDLSALDANAISAGDQAFAFIGTAAFSGVAGQLRYAAAGSDTLVSADVNGDSNADFAVLLKGTHMLGAGNFAL